MSAEEPATEALYEVGRLASVVKLLRLPDGTVKVLVEGAQRAKVVKYTDRSELIVSSSGCACTATASPPRARGLTSCVRRRGARSCAEIRPCRAAAAPDRLGSHPAQAVGVALQWSWPQAQIVVPLRRDPPVCSHDRVPMGRERTPGRRSNIRAQRAGMIHCVPSQDLIRLRKLNDSRRLWVGNHQIPHLDEVLRRHTHLSTGAPARRRLLD